MHTSKYLIAFRFWIQKYNSITFLSVLTNCVFAHMKKLAVWREETNRIREEVQATSKPRREGGGPNRRGQNKGSNKRPPHPDQGLNTLRRSHLKADRNTAGRGAPPSTSGIDTRVYHTKRKQLNFAADLVYA